MSIHQKRERNLLWIFLGVFAVAVINLTLFSVRWDLTSAGAYSISPASKAIMAQAKDRISLTFFLSKKLTTYDSSSQGIADFLQEFAAASNGKVQVRVVDPQETGQLSEMPRLGLQGQPIQVIEQNQQTQAIVYSGIVLKYQDRQEVLPWASQIETLEYDLAVKLNKLVTQKQKTVALLIADPALNLQTNFSYLSQTLAKTVTFRQVQMGEAVGDASVLIVAGSKGFTPAALKPIDDYLMKGGKVFFAVDGVFVDIAAAQAIPQPAGDNALLKALEGWGVKVEQAMTHDVYLNTVVFQGPQGPTPYQYPQWPAILAENVSHTNPITSRFAGLSLMWPSPLSEVKVAGVTSEPLVWTSGKSWVVKENFTIDPQRAIDSRRAPNVAFEKKNEAVALTGTFPSAFPSGGVSPETRIVVLGSSAAITNMIQFLGNTGAEDNLAFAENTVDWLSQDEALLSIKTRVYRDKSLTRLQDPQDRASAAFALSFITLGVVPLLIVVWAVIRWLRRRAREQKH